MHARILRVLALLLVARAAAAAEPPPPGGIPDIVGPRSLALGASVGVAAGNDGIFVNPAAVAARKRYSAEAGLFVDRRGAETVGQLLGGSVVDSLTQPVAAGVSYLRSREGDHTGNLWHLVLAGPIAQGFFVGVSGKYLSLKGPENVSAATVDAGVFWQVADYLSLGASGQNLVSIANEAVAPRTVGAGVAIGSDRVFQLTADWRADLDRLEETTNRYGVGAELLLGSLVPLRAGFVHDETLDTQWWSVGAGLVTRNGIALDVAYRQSVDDTSARTIAASLKTYFFD